MSKATVLDWKKQKVILAILSIGCSRRTAARYVGCSPISIQVTANKDPKFKEALAQAENNAEIESMRCIHNAAQQERYWKAATWMLERLNPEDFGKKMPDSLPPAEIAKIITRLAEIIVEEVKIPSIRKKILQKVETLIKNYTSSDKRDQE
ncbi:MAG: hypothetical protein Q4C96_00245 [Planctomycetia bacterium]|nr:hypothetical protein [Planctomycetia bacterium]